MLQVLREARRISEGLLQVCVRVVCNSINRVHQEELQVAGRPSCRSKAFMK